MTQFESISNYQPSEVAPSDGIAAIEKQFDTVSEMKRECNFISNQIGLQRQLR